MSRNKTNKGSSRGSHGLRESMAELDGLLNRGLSAGEIVEDIRGRHPQRVYSIIDVGEPGKHTAPSVRKLRASLEMSQAVFARAIGVSCVLVQSWEQDVRQPSPLACRLLDIISRDPLAWLASLHPPEPKTRRRAS